MKTTGRKPRINQAIELRYENPTADGHLSTWMDSYHNVIGRTYERYDEQTGKFEYTFCDHEGKPMFKSEDLEQLRQEILKHKAVMLEQAHQQRIAKNINKSVAPNHPFKKVKREKEVPNQTVSKEVKAIANKVSEESREILHTLHDFATGEGKDQSQPKTREETLKELRKGKGQDREQELSR